MVYERERGYSDGSRRRASRSKGRKDNNRVAERLYTLANDIHDAAVPHLKRIIGQLPEYDLHDEDHSVAVIANIEAMLGDKLPMLSPYELFLLFTAAYIHNLGVAMLWLQEFVPNPDSFDWDEGNMHKNLKNGYTCKNVESIFRQEKYVFAGKIIEPSHEEWRGLILGMTDDARPVALIFTRRGEKLRPISCRSTRINERRLYEEIIQQG